MGRFITGLHRNNDSADTIQFLYIVFFLWNHESSFITSGLRTYTVFKKINKIIDIWFENLPLIYFVFQRHSAYVPELQYSLRDVLFNCIIPRSCKVYGYCGLTYEILTALETSIIHTLAPITAVRVAYYETDWQLFFVVANQEPSWCQLYRHWWHSKCPKWR